MQKEKREKSLETVYGIHPIFELLKAKRRRLITLYTTKPEPKIWVKLEPLLAKGTQIQYVTREILTKIAGSPDHQGLVAYATSFSFRKTFFDPKKETFLLMLDGIQDPRNLGAIIRTAYCTNISGIILTQRGSAPLNATVLKASAGLAEHVSIFLAPSPSAAAQQLQQAGYHCYLAVLEKGENALNIDYQKPLCLIIGSEDVGISSAIKKYGTLITLPQKQTDISYNASVAAGILLFLIASKHHTI